MARTRFFNAYTYTSSGSLQPVQLVTEHGRIAALSHASAPLAAERHHDCGGALLLPGMIGAHLHLPGSLLYGRHGVDLMDCASLDAYQSALLSHRTDRAILRGFGWSQRLFQESPGAMSRFLHFLNETFPTLPVLLFSDDYHSCLCNDVLLRQAAAVLPPPQDKTCPGFLAERSVFALLHTLPELSFRHEELEDALLAYQALLLSRGITAVQTLMPIGMDEGACWELLQDLERRGLWHIHTHFAVTAHPADDPGAILQRIRTLQNRQTEHLRLNTVKIYIDGVVDNGSAYLSQPYEDSDSCGDPIWDSTALESFCTLFDRENLQIHAHVIGDAAAAQITAALEQALHQNGRSENKNRHVLAHVQLADADSAERMARCGLLCALQPFWFPQDAVYAVDRARLGARSGTEYPCASLLHRGIPVSFGSDSPVTPDPAPLDGIACAMHRKDTPERLTFTEALHAYTTAGAYQLFREKELGRLSPGYRADFLRLTPPASEPFSATPAPSLLETYSGGQCVYQRKEMHSCF